MEYKHDARVDISLGVSPGAELSFTLARVAAIDRAISNLIKRGEEALRRGSKLEGPEIIDLARCGGFVQVLVTDDGCRMNVE